MRKFGCNILAVVQQYDVIRDSPVRGAMIGNSKIFPELKYGNRACTSTEASQMLTGWSIDVLLLFGVVCHA